MYEGRGLDQVLRRVLGNHGDGVCRGSAGAMKPPIHIYDPAFRYTNSVETDLRKRFARVIREQKEIARAKAEQTAREHRVLPLKRRV